MRWLALVTILLATAAGSAAFVTGTPPERFLAGCLAGSSGESVVDLCKEQLLELRTDRTLGTVSSIGATLILVPAVFTTYLAFAAWLPIWLRR